MQLMEMDGIHRIEIAGRVDVNSAPALEQLCNQLLDGGHNRIICDFFRNEYVSSAGLRVFLSGLKRCRKSGGNMVLCRLKPGILEIFDMTGFTSLFPLFDSLEAAHDFFRVSSSKPELKTVSRPDEVGEILIEKPTKEAAQAYAAAARQIRMDEKA